MYSFGNLRDLEQKGESVLDPHLPFLLHFEHPWLDSPNIEITVASNIRDCRQTC